MFCYILADGTRVLLVTESILKALENDNCHIKTRKCFKNSWRSGIQYFSNTLVMYLTAGYLFTEII